MKKEELYKFTQDLKEEFCKANCLPKETGLISITGNEIDDKVSVTIKCWTNTQTEAGLNKVENMLLKQGFKLESSKQNNMFDTETWIKKINKGLLGFLGFGS